MLCTTSELARPFMSTRDVDGYRFDREEIQDLAYDGCLAEEGRFDEHRSKEKHNVLRVRRRGEPSV
jgi:hypothetical protein